jgi:hypothetical protein
LNVVGSGHAAPASPAEPELPLELELPELPLEPEPPPLEPDWPLEPPPLDPAPPLEPDVEPLSVPESELGGVASARAPDEAPPSLLPGIDAPSSDDAPHAAKLAARAKDTTFDRVRMATCTPERRRD